MYSQSEFDKMVNSYEKGNRANLPKDFVTYYERGYGMQLTQSKIDELKQGYVNSEVVENPFTHGKITLSPVEVALYDYIMGVERAPYYGIKTTKNDRMLAQECKMWIADHNRKAYMILLD